MNSILEKLILAGKKDRASLILGLGMDENLLEPLLREQRDSGFIQGSWQWTDEPFEGHGLVIHDLKLAEPQEAPPSTVPKPDKGGTA